MNPFNFLFRERLALWLARRDTVLLEAFLVGAAFVIAWRVVDVVNGQPVARFTSPALFRLNDGVWWFALAGNGLTSLLALIYGLATGNTFRVRGLNAFAGSLVWTALLVAVLSSRGPLSVASGYALLAFFSWATFLVLMVKADIHPTSREV